MISTFPNLQFLYLLYIEPLFWCHFSLIFLIIFHFRKKLYNITRFLSNYIKDCSIQRSFENKSIQSPLADWDQIQDMTFTNSPTNHITIQYKTYLHVKCFFYDMSIQARKIYWNFKFRNMAFMVSYLSFIFHVTFSIWIILRFLIRA